MKHVIIGNGIAGVTAAETIRKINPEDPITILAGEKFPPYSRPMISMVLEGSVSNNRLPIRRPDFCEELGIETAIGEWVRKIDVQNRQIETEIGKRISFDKLLIASGADPRVLMVPGGNLQNIFPMRTQAHVQGMLSALHSVKRAVVLGGGLVGFKAAYGLMRRGVKVTLLIRSEYPLSMQVDEYAGRLLLDELTNKGLEVRVGAEVAAFEGNGKVQEVLLTDWTRLSCDLVVIGKGVLPATSFIPKDLIKVDLGVLVDDYLQTSVPGIYAAGDVAEHFDVARKARCVNAIWPVAVEQGYIAGANMTGRRVLYRGSLSRNVIRIFNMDVLTAGLVNGLQGDTRGVDHIAYHDKRTNTYRKLTFRNDNLIGVTMVNNIEQGGVLMSLIHQEVPIQFPRERLLDPCFNYASLIRGWSK